MTPASMYFLYKRGSRLFWLTVRIEWQRNWSYVFESENAVLIRVFTFLCCLQICFAKIEMYCAKWLFTRFPHLKCIRLVSVRSSLPCIIIGVRIELTLNKAACELSLQKMKREWNTMVWKFHHLRSEMNFVILNGFNGTYCPYLNSLKVVGLISEVCSLTGGFFSCLNRCIRVLQLQLHS